MPAQLLALNDGPSILVDKPILLLGRHPECDILINSRKISRRHCCIAQVEDYLVVRDLDSTNGIRINGVRVLEGKLHCGDELTIGGSRYKVAWDEAGVLTPPRPAPPTPPLVPAAVQSSDVDLEECDEPVPLLEARRGPRTPRQPVANARPSPPQLKEAAPLVAPEDDSDSSEVEESPPP